MKILFYIHDLGIGGAETIVARYLIALKTRGIDVVLVTNERVDSFLTKEIEEKRIKTISLYPQIGHSLLGKVKRRLVRRVISAEKRWNDIIKAEDPDVIHINTNIDFFCCPEFYSTKKLVYTFHGEVPRSLKIYGKENYAKLKKLADCGMNFFSLSNRMTKDIRDIFGTENIYYVPNGVDLEEIKSRAYSRHDARIAFGVDDGSFVVGQVGRFQPVKNQMKTISVFYEILKRKPNSILVFIGGGDENYQNQVKQKARALGLLDKIIFAGIRKDATALMCGFDCMVLPSVSESFSLVLVEAQAQNIKCVSSTAVPEEVVCNSNCIALSLDDSDNVWADYIVGDINEHHKETLSSFEMSNVISNMVKSYQEIALKCCRD